jgi:uncharacterized protein (DUF885 family)
MLLKTQVLAGERPSQSRISPFGSSYTPSLPGQPLSPFNPLNSRLAMLRLGLAANHFLLFFRRFLMLTTNEIPSRNRVMPRLCAALWILLIGCLAGPSGASGASADREFNKTAEDYLAGYLAWRPQNGTALGFHQYDGKTTDLSRASLDAELARLTAFEQRLATLDSTRLSPPAFYDYRLLRSAIQREIFSFNGLQKYSQNPMTYAGALDVNIYIKRNFAPLPARVHSITAILQQAPAIVAAAHSNLSESLPRPQIQTAIEQADGAADFLSQDLVTALKEVKEQPLMSQFTASNTRAIAELRALSKWLKEEKLPKANEHYALGRDKYRQLLQSGEMVELTPEELLAIGTRELESKQKAFAEAARQIDPGKKPIDVFQALQKDHPTEQGLIPDTRRDLDMIRQFVLDRKLIDIPSRVRAQVTETPQYLRATSFASMDTPGPFERKATEAYYYVTPPDSNWTPQQKEDWLTAFNYYTTDVVSIHEAYPGHYVQFLCLNASPATKLEKLFGSYAFIEGWAHYCEQMTLDEGFGDYASRCSDHATNKTQHASSTGSDQALTAAKYRLAQTDEALLRVCRLCVSIKMHCQGMTVDEGTRFFQDNCYYAEKAAHEEAMRGAFDPEYLYYTLGKLEFLKLREDYQKQEGANYSLRKFHDEVLRHGAPPLRLLREVMLKDRALWGQLL